MGRVGLRPAPLLHSRSTLWVPQSLDSSPGLSRGETSELKARNGSIVTNKACLGITSYFYSWEKIGAQDKSKHYHGKSMFFFMVELTDTREVRVRYFGV